MLRHAFSVTAPVVPSHSCRSLAGREGERLRRGPLRPGAKRSESDTAPARNLGASTTSSRHATVAASNNREQTSQHWSDRSLAQDGATSEQASKRASSNYLGKFRSIRTTVSWHLLALRMVSLTSARARTQGCRM